MTIAPLLYDDRATVLFLQIAPACVGATAPSLITKPPMISRTSFVAVALALTAGFQSAPSQPSKPIVGKWNIEYERGRRMENDNVTSVMGKAVLTIRQQGDSLIAVLDAPPRDDGTPTPQQTIGGHDGAEGAVFVAKSQAKVNINGEMSSVDMIVTWTLKANGDALSGTVFREMLGGPATLVPTPVTGSRAK